HSAQAVATSMQMWQQWAQNPVWDGAALNWASHSEAVRSAFRDQGERWRVLLAGEKDPLDELSAGDYVDAGGYLLGRLRMLLQQFALQSWPALVALVILVVAGVAVAVLFLGSPEVRGAGAIVSVFSGLGITAVSVGSALRPV